MRCWGLYSGPGHAGKSTFLAWPILGPLLFENATSDARDHCANERSTYARPVPPPHVVVFVVFVVVVVVVSHASTFLSYLRLSVYMSIVAVAIVLSFHLKSEPSQLELRMAKPLGIVFWILAVACLCLGLGNYIKTVNKYSRKAAIVQTGWRTQLVLSIVALSIVGTCAVLLVIAKITANAQKGKSSHAAVYAAGHVLK
ncbi:hypothetical protein CSHISOI_09178 [Colletotrichum shisoi]|uniref:DUF202 domain-containing protein n=1 Tax=Colletotrichum shisoi TaxID=2078593 RepID=A0A5Q4BI71_9PEZI|nr:hypothetical protein CSHISOI_09178 [Colletotrichum shisoi]